MKNQSSNRSLRAIPAVEKVVQALGASDLPRPVIVSIVRRELAAIRSETPIPDLDSILTRIRTAVHAMRSSRIQRVLNGTGILVHTNLGRSPLGPEVVQTLCSIAANYNNLEYNLVSGERGGRAQYLEAILALLCEAEAATVVNNCAAALVLILRHFATGPKNEVIISRGELVQIGGGFRIPEILEASGATLREVGATNKTSLEDYERAIGPATALILKVHRSNFFMDGFVDSPSTEEIAKLAGERQLPFVEDLGSGAITATEIASEVEHEPTPAEVLRRGVDLVCFSGDKLMGGPQAGVIAGRTAFVTALKREPFFRALRCDKLILSALQATVDVYLSTGDTKHTTRHIPVLRMMQETVDELRRRAEQIVHLLSDLPVKASVGSGEAQIGGGTLPRSVMESATVDLVPNRLSLEQFAARLRAAPLPLIGYISEQRFKIDLRTIFPDQDPLVTEAIRAALT